MKPPVEIGWFPITYSEDLPKRGVEPIRCFGREMVLYRGEDGIARVLDAHCRHLGAHLGYGGKVDGPSIRCPFHGWRWNETGHCDDVPYASKIPPGATLRAWRVGEANGLVLVWSGSGEPDVELPPVDTSGSIPHRRGARGVAASGTIREHSVTIPDGRTFEAERSAVGPGLFVDRWRGPIELSVFGGWTPVDAERGHLRSVWFTPGRKTADDVVEALWKAAYGRGG